MDFVEAACTNDFSFSFFLFCAVTPIPESSPMTERSNAVSAMCQQLSQGLSLLSSTDDPFLTEDTKVTLDVPIDSTNG